MRSRRWLANQPWAVRTRRVFIWIVWGADGCRGINSHWCARARCNCGVRRRSVWTWWWPLNRKCVNRKITAKAQCIVVVNDCWMVRKKVITTNYKFAQSISNSIGTVEMELKPPSICAWLLRHAVNSSYGAIRRMNIFEAEVNDLFKTFSVTGKQLKRSNICMRCSPTWPVGPAGSRVHAISNVSEKRCMLMR